MGQVLIHELVQPTIKTKTCCKGEEKALFPRKRRKEIVVKMSVFDCSAKKLNWQGNNMLLE